MASIKGTKTEKNLLASFAGESQARNRYTYFARVAEKEGYPQIAAIFLETADNERLHAKRMFSFLEGGAVEITASYPAGVVGDTAANLAAAADGEKEEYTQLYPGFAATAKQEGFNEVSAMYAMVSKAEAWHEQRYRQLLDNVKNGTVFKKAAPVKWKCQKCGYIHEGVEPPKKCPACLHDRTHFEVLAENW